MSGKRAPKQALSLRVPADLLEQIDALAQAETRTRSQQILHLVRLALRDVPAPSTHRLAVEGGKPLT